MELDQDMETMCAEATRCFDGLVDRYHFSMPISRGIEHCPDWPCRSERSSCSPSICWRSFRPMRFYHAKSRPLTSAELDSADAFCDRREETEAYLAAIADQQATAQACGVDVALIHTCRTAFVN